MAEKDYKAIIVEGEAREPQIIDNICRVFFKNSRIKVITLPAGQNIYMLWKRMKADEFETDIIEVLREGSDIVAEMLEGLSRDVFSEVFLFFDYDGHQNNLMKDGNVNSQEVLLQMLKSFDNETENGKLYISYPMVEALRDFSPVLCVSEKHCYCEIMDASNYKQISAERAIYSEFKKYDFEIWKSIMTAFVVKVSCLFDKKEPISYAAYINMVTPGTVFEMQKLHTSRQRIFVLSAFPEFLLDYFGERLWRKCVTHNRIALGKCKASHK